MPTGNESFGQQSALQSTLDAGIESVSTQQSVEFREYTKVTLSQDGLVFWVWTPTTMTVSGSLHYATDRRQEVDETIGANQVLLTSEQQISEFNVLNPSTMWIGYWPISEYAPELRVVFSQRGAYYDQSKTWHYSGFAVYPALSTQIIDDPTQIPPGPIASNSLPIWLSLAGLTGQPIPVYPSFLVPDNILPPYVVAHIEPEGTEMLAAAPLVGPWPGTIEPNSGASPLHLLSVSQLARDNVLLILYGFSNAMAWDFFASICEGSETGTIPFGFANSPAIRDAKRVQSEITTIAQKKTIQIDANYNMGAADALARRLILSAMLTVLPLGGEPPFGPTATAQDDQVVNAAGSIFE